MENCQQEGDGEKMYSLKDTLMLSDKGYSDLKKAIAACTLLIYL